MVLKHIYKSLILFTLAPVVGIAQQAPVITVHKDEKPAYESPFDKPATIERRYEVPASAPAKPAVQTPAAVVSSRVQTIKSTEREVTVKSAKPVVSNPPTKSEVLVNSNTVVKTATPPVPVPAQTQAPAAVESVTQQKDTVNVRAVPAQTTTVTPLPNTEPTGTPTMAGTEASTSHPATTSAATPDVSAASANTAEIAQEKPAVNQPSQAVAPAVVQDAPAAEPIVRQVIDKLNFTAITELLTPNVVKALLAGIAIILIGLAYLVKVHLFAKDPALSDPWFKPVKR